MNPDQVAVMLKYGVEVEHERQVFDAKIRGFEVKTPHKIAQTKMTKNDTKKFDSMIDKITQNKLREARGRGR